MFRSAGANGTNGLYSPIANSDSSGFSEQRADLSSYSGSQGGPPGGYTTFNPAFRPVAGTGQGHIYDRSVLLFFFFCQIVITHQKKDTFSCKEKNLSNNIALLKVS